MFGTHYVACNHAPKFVVVGDRRVFLCGMYDILHSKKAMAIISKLDIFVGLDDLWEEYQRDRDIRYTNPLVSRLYNRLCCMAKLDNLFVIEVPDQSTNEGVAKEVITLFKEGYNIGFGCLGGHGRTGWLYGRLLMEIEGLQGNMLLKEIRRRWCKEAVESDEQYKSLGLDKRRKEVFDRSTEVSTIKLIGDI